MKKLSLLFSVFVLLTAFTCENEPLEGDFQSDDNNNTNPSQIVGEWSVIEFEATVNSSTEFFGETFDVEFIVDGFDFDYIVVFDGSNYTTNGSYSINSTTYTNGESSGTFSETYSNVSGGGTYTIDGEDMVIDGSFFELDGTTSFSDSPQTASYELSQDGQILTITQDEQDVPVEGGGDINATVTITSVTVLERL